jgi:hypothetical protein
MIARNKYINVTSGSNSSQNTNALYNSLKKDYIDAKAIYENLISLKRNLINVGEPKLIINANDSDFTKSAKRATYGANKAIYDMQIAEFDVQIAAAKLVMDKAKFDFDSYAKSDVYKLGVQNEESKRQFDDYKAQQEVAQAQIEADKANIEATYKAELENQKKNQTIYLYIGGAAIVGLGLLFLLKK